MVKFQRNPQWIYRNIGKEKQGLLIPLVNSKADLRMVVELNEIASILWENLADPISLDELLDVLRQTIPSSFEVESGWEKDICACMEIFAEESLVLTHPLQA